MVSFVSLPLFAGLIILQSAVISRMPLLQGTADLSLLVIIAWSFQEKVKNAWQWAVIAGILGSLATALPFGTLAIAYLGASTLTLALKRRVWKGPILAMLIATLLGSLLFHITTYLAVTTTGLIISPIQAIELILLPGTLLNILICIPVFIIVRDFANFLYPNELEV